MKYKKKPVVIEATQWFKLGDHPDVMDYHTAWDLGHRCFNPSHLLTISNPHGKGLIQTLEGWHEVTPSDYVITGVQGETYACKADIFELTYEELE